MGRTALLVLTGFLGVTAAAGGVALVFDVISLPLEWLDGSPFGDYLIPGLALAAIGALALVATALLVLRHAWGLPLAGISGLAITIYEVVEMLVVPFHVLQVVYAVIGLSIALLAWRLSSVLGTTDSTRPPEPVR